MKQYELTPRAGFTMRDIFRMTNLDGIQIVGGSTGLIFLASVQIAERIKSQIGKKATLVENDRDDQDILRHSDRPVRIDGNLRVVNRTGSVVRLRFRQ